MFVEPPLASTSLDTPPKRSRHTSNSSSNPPSKSPSTYCPPVKSSNLRSTNKLSVSKRRKVSPSKPLRPSKPSKPSKTSPSQPSTPPQTLSLQNNDYCSCCGLPGLFLCCESCPKSFHFNCTLPPVDPNNLPDFWYCKECIKKKRTPNPLTNKSTHPASINIGIYSQLFDNIIFQDPLSFQLPNELINTFNGISCDKFGDYNDNTFKPVKSYKQLIKDYDNPLYGKYDSNNNPIFCYTCGQSALNNNQMISCDYCPLSYHLDCINDPLPLTSVKKLGTKWKCNNHVNTLSSSSTRYFKDPKIIRVTNISSFEKNFGKLPPNANIQVINIDDKLDSLKQNLKLLSENNNLNPNFANLKFQIDEDEIILDFINSNNLKRLNQNALNINHFLHLKPSLKDYLLGLQTLSHRRINSTPHHPSFTRLSQLSTILNIDEKIQLKDFSDSELKELLIIKELINLKGVDKLLDFLTR